MGTFIIASKKDAVSYLVEKQINTISSDLEICKMNLASTLGKIDALLNRKDYVCELNEDQRIYLEAERLRMRTRIQEITNVIKGI